MTHNLDGIGGKYKYGKLSHPTVNTTPRSVSLALNVSCPVCVSSKGKPCRNITGENIRQIHRARLDRAKETPK